VAYTVRTVRKRPEAIGAPLAGARATVRYGMILSSEAIRRREGFPMPCSAYTSIDLYS